MNSIICVKKLDKSYGKNDSIFRALRNVNIDIKRGESVAIIGKSGSGKSTLMHLLALLDSPTDGEIIINNELSSTLSRREKDILRNSQFGFVFQQFFLNSNNTVLDNVILPLKIAGVGRRERNERGLKVLEAVELTGKAKNKANNLSGGEKQRVVIARALINNPDIIFADEPTGNLDSITGGKIEDMLFSLNETKQITLIIVTHDTELAARCSRQIRLKDGKIIEDSK